MISVHAAKIPGPSTNTESDKDSAVACSEQDVIPSPDDDPPHGETPLDRTQAQEL